jgi:hypothetical protein
VKPRNFGPGRTKETKGRAASGALIDQPEALYHIALVLGIMIALMIAAAVCLGAALLQY